MGKFAYRAYLDGLRGISVVAVLLFHIGTPQFREGFIGVDVFFVLSGYLITSIILVEIETKGRIDIIRFYARRARRILPGAAVAILIVAVLERFIDIVKLMEDGNCILSAATYWSNFCFIIEGTDYWQQEKAVNPVKHYWSLSIEEQFYLFYPFGLLIILGSVRSVSKILVYYRIQEEEREFLIDRGEALSSPSPSPSSSPSSSKSMTSFLITSLIILGMCATASCGFCVYLTISSSPTVSHMNSFGRIYQLFSGAILSIILFFHWSPRSDFVRLLHPRILRISSVLSLMGLMFLMFYPLIYEDIYIRGTYSGMFTNVLVLLLIFSVESEMKVKSSIINPITVISEPPPLPSDKNDNNNNKSNNNNVNNNNEQDLSLTRKFLGNRVFVYLGKWSYSIYLWHFPFIVFGDMLGYLPGLDGNSIMRRHSYCFIGSIFLGILSYYVVERTIMRISIDSVIRKRIFASMGILVPLSIAAFLFFVVIPRLSSETDVITGLIPMDLYEYNLTTATEITGGEEIEEDIIETFYGSRVFFYGDSVGGRGVTQMFKKMSQSMGFEHYLFSSNNYPAFVNKEYNIHPVVYKYCAGTMRKKMNALDPDIIFIENNVLERECCTNGIWSFYTGKLGKDMVCAPFEHDEYKDFMVTGINLFLDRYIDASREIPMVIFPPSPRAGKVSRSYFDTDDDLDENPADCLKRVQAKKLEYVEGMCDRKMFHPYFYNDVKNALIEISNTRNHTKVIEWDTWICPNGTCPAKVQGVPRWHDNLHFTAEGSIMRMNEFVKMLEDHRVYLMSPERKEELLNAAENPKEELLNEAENPKEELLNEAENP